MPRYLVLKVFVKVHVFETKYCCEVSGSVRNTARADTNEFGCCSKWYILVIWTRSARGLLVWLLCECGVLLCGSVFSARGTARDKQRVRQSERKCCFIQVLISGAQYTGLVVYLVILFCSETFWVWQRGRREHYLSNSLEVLVYSLWCLVNFPSIRGERGADWLSKW